MLYLSPGTVILLSAGYKAKDTCAAWVAAVLITATLGYAPDPAHRVSRFPRFAAQISESWAARELMPVPVFVAMLYLSPSSAP